MKKLALCSAGKIIPKMKFLIDKHSPEIWLGAGIVCIVGGTVLACKASRNIDSIMGAHEGKREMIDIEYYEAQDALEDNRVNGSEPDEESLEIVKNYKKECARCTLITAGEFVKEYAPAVILITGGIGMIINGHRILCKRNAALLAAYSTLEQAFTDYRGRVAQRYGNDVENDIYTGKTYTEETKIEIDENGKKKKIKEQVPVVGTSVSPYARFFDAESTDEWQKSPSYNHTFLICQQNSANDKLRRDGYLFLNTVYRMLGLSETPTGAICGWILPKDDELHDGDNYVDFGMFDTAEDNNHILLDFNCQGIIYDLI